MYPVGAVTAEVADTEPELRAVAAEVTEGWIEDGSTAQEVGPADFLRRRRDRTQGEVALISSRDSSSTARARVNQSAITAISSGA